MSLVVLRRTLDPIVGVFLDELYEFGAVDGASLGGGVNLTQWDSFSAESLQTYSSAHAVEGSFSARVAVTANTAYASEFFAPANTLAARIYLWMDAFTDANTLIARLMFGGTARAEIRMNPDGTINLRNVTTVTGSASAVLPTAGWVRIDWKVDGNSATQNARLWWGANLHGTVTPDSTISGTYTNAEADTFRLGSQTAATWTVWYDAVALSNQAAYIEPVFPPTTLSPTGITSGEAVGTPSVTVSAVAVTVSPAAVTSGEAFGTSVVTPGAVTVSPAAVTTGQAFGTAVVAPGAVTTAPAAVLSGETFGAPALTAGAVTVSPSAVGGGEVFGAPTATAGAVTAAPGSVASAETFGSPAATVGAVTAAPAGVASGELFGSPSATAGAVQASPAALGTAETFGAPAVTTGPVEVAPTGVPSAAEVGAPEITGSVALLIEGLTDDFDDDTIDPLLWTHSYGDPIEAGGRARVPVTAGYAAFQSAPVWTLTGSQVQARVWPPAAGGAAAEALAEMLVLTTTGGTDAGFSVNTAAGELRMVSRSGYFDGAAVTVPYDPVGHAWLRLRETGGLLLWETSPDGVVWTAGRSAAAPGWVSDSTLSLALAGHRDSGVDDVAEFDFLNIPPPVTVTAVGVPSSAALGVPAVAVGSVTLVPVGVASAETWGEPLLAAFLTVTPGGVPPGEAFGSPLLSGAEPAVTSGRGVVRVSVSVGRVTADQPAGAVTETAPPGRVAASGSGRITVSTEAGRVSHG